MPHGKITFLIAILMIIAGLLELPSKIDRGMTAPGVYENKSIVMKDSPAIKRHDFWVNQEIRKKERGK